MKSLYSKTTIWIMLVVLLGFSNTGLSYTNILETTGLKGPVQAVLDERWNYVDGEENFHFKSFSVYDKHGFLESNILERPYNRETGCLLESDRMQLVCLETHNGDPIAETVYLFDREGRLSSTKGTLYGASWPAFTEKIYDYDAAGRIVGERTFADGLLFHEETWTYDERGVLTQKSWLEPFMDGSAVAVETLEFDGRSNLVRGIVHIEGKGYRVNMYGADELIKEVLIFNGKGLFQGRESYRYDKEGNVIGHVSFDERDQITAAWSEEWEYDGYGNWVTRHRFRLGGQEEGVEKRQLQFVHRRTITYHLP